MKTKESSSPSFYNIRNRFKSRKLTFGLTLIFIYSLLLILLGGEVQKQGIFGEVIIPVLQQNINIPLNYLKGVLSDPEKLIIDIKYKDYQKLSYKRNNALREGVLHTFPDDYVNAKVRWNGRTTKVKLRLKGDLSDHWARDYKWSLRVKTKGEGSILGMKNFSLQHPRTRGFFNDWVLHKILKKEGLIALRYNFVDVVINGKQLGIYAIEEHFEQKLLENNQRIDGPIIRLKDHLLWYLVDPKTGFTKDEIDELYTVSPIDAFTSTRINNNNVLLNNFNNAKNLLESFRRGKLKTSEVFDTEKLAKLFAVVDLFGYQHSTAYSNIRFYYNPFTSRLEPIGYDTTFIEELKSIEGQGKQVEIVNPNNSERLNWKDTFFEDRIFFEKYIAELRKVSQITYLDDMFDETADEFNTAMNKVYKSFPAYSFDTQKSILYKNQNKINMILNPVEGIQAYVKKIDKANHKITLEVGNNQFLPILINNISINGNVYQLSKKTESLLQTKSPFSPIMFKDIHVSLPTNISWLDGASNDIKVYYTLLGQSEIREIAAFPWSYLDSGFLESDVMRKKPNINEFDFIKTSEAEKEIHIKTGSWVIDKNLIIPEGYTVICGPKTELDIIGSSFILSYSPLKLLGDKVAPIVIRSSDQTGQGILILKTDKKSIFNNVILRNMSSPNQTGLNINGALTFYESDFEMSNTKFLVNLSEIDLHIVRSNFNITQSLFNKSKKLALNSIFSDGKISNTTFNNSGLTAIDATGSRIDAENIEISNIKTNALNVTDRSKLNVSNISVSNTRNAFISNNSSIVDVEQLTINNCNYAFSALQTKTEYGPSVIRISDYDESHIDGSFLIEDNSTLFLNQNKYETYTQDVLKKLSTL